ncbi:hypothetical protein [Nocardia coubleae]|uniref:Uncharacterized protein n=1 Tax=Nocardia coubleae TaxID=356147 RepID=A0A846W7B3_9NOCA|nr:hypothetical protein [Nocardia coubleae]NKX88358.1 hypothetical protein [Nocardia coubleae]
MNTRTLALAAGAFAVATAVTCGPATAADTTTGSDAVAPLLNELVMSGSGQGVITGSNAITSGTANDPATPGLLCSLSLLAGSSAHNILCEGYIIG